ncbi:DUF2256 domain-containing protein [Asaia lannensis]|uniref:DUF2256 domain-containing protein n=1 Tax=Asaia lannensis TaxID=415421 RepID=UPI001C9932AA
MARGKGRVAPKPDKANLPAKLCPVCHRPFSWRRKWARDWDRVRYCSDKCRRQSDSAPHATGSDSPSGR